MSNSSKTDSTDNLEGVAFGDGYSRLLNAIADEIVRAANEIVKLGEALSDDAAKSKRPQSSYDLQAIDSFAQNAHAQARLLKQLAVGDTGEQSVEIARLIDEVPFASIRRRLKGAAAGGPADAVDERHDGDVSWF